MANKADLKKIKIKSELIPLVGKLSELKPETSVHNLNLNEQPSSSKDTKVAMTAISGPELGLNNFIVKHEYDKAFEAQNVQIKCENKSFEDRAEFNETMAKVKVEPLANLQVQNVGYQETGPQLSPLKYEPCENFQIKNEAIEAKQHQDEEKAAFDIIEIKNEELTTFNYIPNIPAAAAVDEEDQATQSALEQSKFKENSSLVQKISDNNYICLKCPSLKAKTSLASINRHIQMVHQGIKYTCEQCSKDFCSENVLKMHKNRSCKGYKKSEQNNSAALITTKYIDVTKNVIDNDEIDETKHMLGNNRYKCLLCPKVFISVHKLRIHIRAIHCQTTYQCFDCPKKFLNRAAFRRHALEKHATRLKFNNIYLERESRYANDIKKVENYYICTKCPPNSKQFTKDAYVKIHLRAHHYGIKYKCEHCNKSYTVPSALKRHAVSHLPDKKKHDTAEKDLTQQGNYEERNVTKETPCAAQEKKKNDNKPNVSRLRRKKRPAAEKDLTQSGKYEVRYVTREAQCAAQPIIDQRHIKNDNFICIDCPAEYKTRSSLMLHISSHTRQAYQCPECQQQFQHQKEFLQHAKKQHLLIIVYTANPLQSKKLCYKKDIKKQGSVYVCLKCNSKPLRPAAAFESDKRSKVVNHIRLEHLRLKYQCTKCQQTFRSKAYARTHVQQQHKIEPKDFAKNIKLTEAEHSKNDYKCIGKHYVCNLCNDSRKYSKNSIRPHIRSKHYGDRYDCEACDEQYDSKEKCVQHLLQHSDGKASANIIMQFKKVAVYTAQLIENPTHADGSTKSSLNYEPSEYRQNFICTLCINLTEFQAKQSFHTHIREAHMPGKHLCMQCSICFDKRQDLFEHARQVHEDNADSCSQEACYDDDDDDDGEDDDDDEEEDDDDDDGENDVTEEIDDIKPFNIIDSESSRTNADNAEPYDIVVKEEYKMEDI